MPTRSASARYDGLGKDGKGHVSTQSGLITNGQYGFSTRFEDGPGTNPEELLAAAHASCFTMALAFALEGEGYKAGTLETTGKVSIEKQGGGWGITKSALSLTGTVVGIDDETFRRIAQQAKENCPLSKVIDAEITLDVTLN